eukprot:5926971-Heterocapsa_arctica.AAC.1
MNGLFGSLGRGSVTNEQHYYDKDIENVAFDLINNDNVEIRGIYKQQTSSGASYLTSSINL